MSRNSQVNDSNSDIKITNLIDTASYIIEIIWANLPINPSAKIIPLRLFLQEILRRSRTSYSTLQTASYYLFRIKPQISLLSRNPKFLPTLSSDSQNNNPATCGRRMFIAALIVASKYLQDHRTSSIVWSNIVGLPVHEINSNEICFLKLIDYNLFVAEETFKCWSSALSNRLSGLDFDCINTSSSYSLLK